MIEINLLPEDMRQQEGTPPARLAVIILGVVLTCVTGFFISRYYLSEIPKMKLEITIRNQEIKDREAKKAEIEKTQKKITDLTQKVDTLEKLIRDRIRYARLLDRLCDAVPATGAWFRTFAIQKDNMGGGGMKMGGAAGGGGARYQINLTGYTTGGNQLDGIQKLTELMNKMESEFRVRDVDPKTGVNTFIGAKFEPASLTSRNWVKISEPKADDPRMDKALKSVAPKEGWDFVMTMKFELEAPPPVGATTAAAPAPGAAPH